ncbi:MAG: hypothetical protein IJW99_06190 [Clostridia bacterium]|nr:hypothetical protein [Clostridia bacterium]
MKNILSLGMVLILMLGALVLPASAATVDGKEVDSLVVLGDSISTGYGLDGTVYTRPSYANLVASALGLAEGKGYVNYAVDGYTSAQVLQKAKDQQSTVAGADLIIMTVGGNDVMWKMLDIAMRSVGVSTLDLTQIAIAMAQTDPQAVANSMYSAENTATITKALESYRTNLTALVAYLHTVNPEARVLFLTQYNPSSGMTSFGILQTYSEEVLTQLNDVMTEVVTSGGYEIVDAHAVMEGKGAEMSNIVFGDIHPNTFGHAMMAQKVKTYLNITQPTVTTAETTAETTVTEPETQAQTTEISTETAASETQEPAVSTSEETDSQQTLEKLPTEEEEKGTGLPLLLAISLLALGAAVVVIAVLFRKKT